MATLVIVSISISSIVFLLENQKNIRFYCKIIINVEKIFGLYEPGLFLNTSTSSALRHTIPVHFKDFDIKHITILPLEGLLWGKSGTRQAIYWNIAGILLSAIAACSAMYLKYNSNEHMPGAQTQEKVGEKATNSSLGQPYHFDVVIRNPEGVEITKSVKQLSLDVKDLSSRIDSQLQANQQAKSTPTKAVRLNHASKKTHRRTFQRNSPRHRR